MPDAQVGVSPGCLRSPSARTSPAVRATQSSAAATPGLHPPYVLSCLPWRRASAYKHGGGGCLAPGAVQVLADGLGHRVVGTEVLLAVGQGPLQHRDHVGAPA